jgi:hypothetical protein
MVKPVAAPEYFRLTSMASDDEVGRVGCSGQGVDDTRRFRG